MLSQVCVFLLILLFSFVSFTLSARIHYHRISANIIGEFTDTTKIVTPSQCAVKASYNKKIGFRVTRSGDSWLCEVLLRFGRFATEKNGVKNYILDTKSERNCAEEYDVTDILSSKCNLDKTLCNQLQLLGRHCDQVGSTTSNCIAEDNIFPNEALCREDNRLCCPAQLAYNATFAKCITVTPLDKSKPKTLDGVHDQCPMDSYPLTIENSDQNKIIESMVPGKGAVIGLYNPTPTQKNEPQDKATFKWKRSKKCNYTNWLDGQPHNEQNEEYLVAIVCWKGTWWNGRWGDANANLVYSDNIGNIACEANAYLYL
ncbi:hypothetical protein L596_028210 [Steinernema carpocapsae]|uniref:C-type lectin domain-containing protein n=1 Tax=Steinernema carpocapsae TaxID=34508 RepID=A0A4U5LXV6_STECR|nr:hypothetical protein L596_028210 [Steinernema carpocapsae]